ncbi:MAG TPA: hypothetical protein VK689_16175, partial [Armatimonadota bacterium]|nr:hypothetical protein [Armatimonadota bacterium]
ELQQQLGGPGSGSGNVTYFRADPIDPRTAGDAREEFNIKLNLRPGSSSRLLLDNYFSRESLFTESYEQNERQRLQFEQTLGKSTAALMWERRRSDGYGVANSLDALSLTLTHPFTRNLAAEGFFSHEQSMYRGRESESLLTLRQLLARGMQAQASVQFRGSEFSGNTLESGLTLFAQPGGSSDVTLGFRRSDSERYGSYQRLSAEFDAAVSKKLQVMGEVSERSSDKLGGIRTYGLGMSARPTARTLLEAAFSESVGEAAGRERSHTARLAVDPSAAVKLQVGYDLLTSDRDGDSENALWIVTLGGRRYVRLEGYAAQYVPLDDPRYRDALYRVEVRPIPVFAVSGHLRRVGNEAEENGVAGVGANLTLTRGVDLSTTYRRPTAAVTAPDLFGRDFKLSLMPVSGLRVFGQYSLRPEDRYGVLLDQTHRSVGLETQLGSFSLQGSITSMQGQLAPDPGQRLDLLASLVFGGATKLYGGIRTQDGLLASDGRSRIYRLGISQTAGPAFFMLLEGQFGWLLDGGGTRTWSADDARAQARLGIRF